MKDSGLQALPKHPSCLVQDQEQSCLVTTTYGWLVILRPTFSRSKKLVEAWHSGTDRFKPFMNILND